MDSGNRHAVTGAFGYSGRYIAQRLLATGVPVRTLTNSSRHRGPCDARIEVWPLRFDDLEALTESLSGVEVLYNTYWVRFNHRRFRHATAVENTLRLFTAARRAGVRRVVHVSITNPSEHSPLEYFRGKAVLELALRDSGLSYAILRPAVLFGGADILLNNIAWMLRRFPVFGVFGDGSYRLRPIHVDDLAQVAVVQGANTTNAVLDAVGPESFSYRELVSVIGQAIGFSRPIVSLPPWLGYTVGKLIGLALRDIVVTREEIAGLMSGLLHVDAEPLGTTSFREWARAHRDSLGRHYASELARR